MASTSSSTAARPVNLDFDVFATRKVAKDGLDRPGKQYIEDYLASLDPYRFTTAEVPLPLPLKSLQMACDSKVALTLDKFLKIDEAARAGNYQHRSRETPGVRPPQLVIEHQYKTELFGPIRDTLRILLRSPDAIENSTWPQYAEVLKVYLKKLEYLTFVTHIPHNISHYDIEIVNLERAYDPICERLDDFDVHAFLSETLKHSIKVYNASRDSLRRALESALGESFVDLSLELQEDQSGTHKQIAVVVRVLPQAKFEWYDLRLEVLSYIRDPLCASRYTETLDIEVEYVPDYHAESLKLYQESVVEDLRKTSPELLKSSGSGANDMLANAMQRPGKEIVRDSAYGTGPEPSPVTPRFSNSGGRGRRSIKTCDSGSQTAIKSSDMVRGFDKFGQQGRSSMIQPFVDQTAISQVPRPQSLTADDIPFLPRTTYQPMTPHTGSGATTPKLQGLNSTSAAVIDGARGKTQSLRPIVDHVNNWMNDALNNALESSLPGPDQISPVVNPFSDAHASEGLTRSDPEPLFLQADMGRAPNDTQIDDLSSRSDDCYYSHPDEPPRSNTVSTKRSDLDPFAISSSEDATVPTPNLISTSNLITPHGGPTDLEATSTGTARLPENVYLSGDLAGSTHTVRLPQKIELSCKYAASKSAAMQNKTGNWDLYPAPPDLTEANKKDSMIGSIIAARNENIPPADSAVESTTPTGAANLQTEDFRLGGSRTADLPSVKTASWTPLEVLTPGRPPGRLDWLKKAKDIPRKLRRSKSKAKLEEAGTTLDSTE